eukprot:TRINITY_DN40596_c0_g1_i1.p1 TRINITY_DN40596_c0_g1~~TRINITY_DN40596_c0_g1_i1.p1  ORF type:complete len:146 (-),score=9.76 TRINITY_DN40596_c0_g1_i1:17-409(-)
MRVLHGCLTHIVGITNVVVLVVVILSISISTGERIDKQGIQAALAVSDTGLAPATLVPDASLSEEEVIAHKKKIHEKAEEVGDSFAKTRASAKAARENSAKSGSRRTERLSTLHLGVLLGLTLRLCGRST